MSREMKVALAQKLRADGLLLREIAERMGVSLKTVSAWLNDPDLERQRARRERYSRPCPQCGRRMDGSSGFNGTRQSQLCQLCRLEQPHTLERSRMLSDAHRDRWRYSDEQLLDVLRTAHALGAHSIKQYDLLHCSQSEFPSRSTIEHRFGTWNEAKRQAGLPVIRPTRATYPRTSAVECAEAVARLWERLGAPPSQIDYDWAADGGPSETLIRIRCGSWTLALEMAAELVGSSVAA